MVGCAVLLFTAKMALPFCVVTLIPVPNALLFATERPISPVVLTSTVAKVLVGFELIALMILTFVVAVPSTSNRADGGVGAPIPTLSPAVARETEFAACLQ